MKNSFFNQDVNLLPKEDIPRSRNTEKENQKNKDYKRAIKGQDEGEPT